MLYITTSNLSPNPQASIGSVSLTSGIATFGQVIPEGQVPNGSYVKVGSLQTQNDIKTTWDDGSIRFVILTCEPGSSGDYDLLVDSSQASPMSPPAILSDTYVDLDIGGSVYRATCPTSHSSDKWLDGSLCVESRFEVVPVTVDGTDEHDFLRVIFDVRSYSVSEYRIDVTVENGINKSGGGLITYDCDFVVNNSSVFSSTSVAHYYGGRWRKKNITGYTESVTYPDISLMSEAHAVPEYDTAVDNNTLSFSGSTEIMNVGDMNWQFSAVGGRPEIAAYPDWVGQYLAHPNSNTRSYLLTMGDLAGTWSCHFREDGTTYTGIGDFRYISLDERANFWLDPAASAANKLAGSMDGLDRGPVNGQNIPDNGHASSLAYVPYLVTGDRYYLDEMTDWAIHVLIKTPTGNTFSRGGSQGLLYSNEPRGMAWGLRNLVDCAAYRPDSDTVKTYLTTKITNNLTFFDDRADNDTTPLGTLIARSYSQYNSQRVTYPGWQMAYFAWALHRAWQHGFSTSNSARNMIVDFAINAWNDEDWPDDRIGFSYIPVSSGTDYEALGDYYTTYLQIYNDWSTGDAPTATPLNGYHGVAYRLVAMIGILLGRSGSQDMYDYIQPFIQSGDYVGREGWGIKVL